MPLVLTTNLNAHKLNKHNKYVYVGCINEKNFNLINNKTYKIENGYEVINLNKKQKIEILNYCEKIFKKTSNLLSIELNKLHEVEIAKKNWEIIFGGWLRDFVYIVYLNFTTINYLLKDKSFDKIITSKYHNEELITSNLNDLIKSYHSIDWTSDLNSKIIEYLNPDIKIECIKKKGEYTKEKINNKFRIKSKIKSIFFYFLNYLAKKNNIFFYETGLNFLFEKFLEIKTLQIPSFWKFPNIDYLNTKIKSDLRNKIKINYDNPNKLELFLQENLKYFLPKFLIENFILITKELKNSQLPTKSNLIITGTGFMNELFNIYSIMQKENKNKLIVLQHGNAYNTHYVNDFKFEYNVPDYFFTWGPKIKKNHVSFYNFNVIFKKKYYKPDGNLTIILEKITTNKPLPFDTYKLKLDMLNSTIDFSTKLRADVKNKIYFRLFRGEKINEILKKLILEKKLKYYKKNLHFKNILKLSRICIFNYDFTGFYENLLLGIPSIIFSNNAYTYLKKKYIKEYKSLELSKLLITDVKKLKNHIEDIWDNPLIWWNSNLVQKTITNFNNSVNYYHKNEFNKLYEKIEKVAKNKN